MKKLIIIGLFFSSSLTMAQSVLPGKLNYYSNQDVANISNSPNSISISIIKDVKLYRYDNETIAKAIGGNKKFKKYDNEAIAKAFGGNRKLQKYDNEAIAKAFGGNKNIGLKQYESYASLQVKNKHQVAVPTTQHVNVIQPYLGSNNLNFDGENQVNINKPIKFKTL